MRLFGTSIRSERVDFQGTLRPPGRGSWGYTAGEGALTATGVVWACVQFMSKKLWAMPRRLVDMDGQPVPGRLPSWMRKPNRWQSWRDVLTAMAISYMLHGDMFVLPTRDAVGRTQEIIVPHPLRMHYTLSEGDYGDIMWAPTALKGLPYQGEVIHSRWMAVPGRVRGIGPIEAAWMMCGTVETGNRLVHDHFDKGAAIQYSLENAMYQSLPEKKMVAAQWEENQAGPDNAWRPLIMSDGWRVNPIGMTAETGRYLELLGWTEGRIAQQIFGLHPSLVAAAVEGQSMTYENAETIDWRVHVDTIEGLLLAIEETLSLITPPGRGFDLDERAVLLGSPQRRTNLVATMALANKHNTGAGQGVVFTETEMRDVVGFAEMIEPTEPASPVTPTAENMLARVSRLGDGLPAEPTTENMLARVSRLEDGLDG